MKNKEAKVVNSNLKLSGFCCLIVACSLLCAHPILAGSSKPAYKLAVGLPRLTVALGIPKNIEPTFDKSINFDTTLGCRIIGARAPASDLRTAEFMAKSWRFIPEIGYQVKRDVKDDQKKYLHLFRSGFSWSYIIDDIAIGIGTSSAFLVGQYGGRRAMGMRNGIHVGLLDCLELDVSYFWIDQENSNDLHFVNFSINIDLLLGTLGLMALAW